MRKDFIDNIRIICIMLLFPFHTSMIYNNWGEIFYITERPYSLPSNFVSIVYPWWMTLLFTIAGISSFYALRKRTIKEYAKERVRKLLTPLIVGLIVIVPVQTYIADVFHNNYSGGYFKHYIVFFTKFTYLTGEDGGYTPAHLWFMLYLFIISILMLPFMNKYNKSNKKINGSKVLLIHLLPMFILILLCTPILEIGGKSLGEALACFAIGFFVLSDEAIQERLERNRFILAIIFLLAIIVRVIMQYNNADSGLIWDMEQRMVTWFGILAILGLSKRYLNKTNTITRYFSKAAFSIYYFHQSILVVLGYVVLQYVNTVWLQFFIIMIGSFLLTLLCYEIFKKFKLTSYMFGIK